MQNRGAAGSADWKSFATSYHSAAKEIDGRGKHAAMGTVGIFRARMDKKKREGTTGQHQAVGSLCALPSD